MGIVILLPLTFGLNATNSILTLVSIYVRGIADGCIPAIAIALNIPGIPASTATTFDGYILTKQGYAGKALSFGLIDSVPGVLLVLFF